MDKNNEQWHFKVSFGVHWGGGEERAPRFPGFSKLRTTQIGVSLPVLIPVLLFHSGFKGTQVN